MEFEEERKRKTEQADAVVMRFLPKEEGFASILLEAMNYSMRSGGKRLRPLLMQETYRVFGGDSAVVEPFMAAIEMIHTHSLIHDDLPAIDNDEFRRGKKTNHAVYGEAMGVLSGDALLNYAYETALKAFDVPEHPERVVAALRILAHKTGAYGMLGGQSVDVMNEKHRQTKIDQNMLNYIYENKTSALIEASMMVGAVLAGAKEEQLAEVEQTAKSIGLAFQIQDDILDFTRGAETGKPSNNDLREHKITLPLLLLLDRADAARRDELLALLARCREDEAAVDALQQAVEEQGGLQEASKVMQSYLQRATALLAEWPDGPIRSALVNLCAYVAERNR